MASITVGITPRLILGDIADSQDDTVVNSTGPEIYLGVSVAKALAARAGEELEKACQQLRPLAEGGVVSTSGYKMPCKQILHCNCPDWKNKAVNKLRLIKLITVCLEMAAQKSHRSIAMPAIGMGLKGYPAELVAASLAAAISEYSQSNPQSSLRLVKIYLSKKDATSKLIQTFEQALSLLEVTPGFGDGERKVIRKVVGQEKYEDKDDEVMPTFWNHTVEEYQEFFVGPNTEEWEQVASTFLQTIGRSKSKVNIAEVKRVQNPDSYKLYTTKRSSVAKKLGKRSSQVERRLWHSTAESNIQKITHNHFDRGLSGAVGGNLLGAGCYFSTTSKYSHQWNIQGDAAESKYMIMARVITGEYCQGDRSMKQAPYKPHSQTEHYDSVVDSVSKPTMFCVFHDASVYPEYIVKYGFNNPDSCTIL